MIYGRPCRGNVLRRADVVMDAAAAFQKKKYGGRGCIFRNAEPGEKRVVSAPWRPPPPPTHDHGLRLSRCKRHDVTLINIVVIFKFKKKNSSSFTTRGRRVPTIIVDRVHERSAATAHDDRVISCSVISNDRVHGKNVIDQSYSCGLGFGVSSRKM